jgi:hypothetical protein
MQEIGPDHQPVLGIVFVKKPGLSVLGGLLSVAVASESNKFHVWNGLDAMTVSWSCVPLLCHTG